jgi:hypothetical protein
LVAGGCIHKNMFLMTGWLGEDNDEECEAFFFEKWQKYEHDSDQWPGIAMVLQSIILFLRYLFVFLYWFVVVIIGLLLLLLVVVNVVVIVVVGVGFELFVFVFVLVLVCLATSQYFCLQRSSLLLMWAKSDREQDYSNF